MCYPALIPLIGAGISAVGSAQAGADAQEAANREAQIGELQGADALTRGNQEEERYRRELAQIVGGQKAAIGARNVKRTGTALDLITDTQQVGDEDALTIQNDAARQAWGYRVGADESRRWGRSARSNATMQAGATLLTGAAQSYGMWKNA
jgi:hypothetical protein